MASTRKKMMQKSKQFLLEKIHRVEADQQWLAQAIMDISEPAIAEAKKLLEETDQKRFFKRYQEVTSTLETSSSTLVLLVASFPSTENDSDGGESNCSADSNSEVYDASVFSNASSRTASSHGSHDCTLGGKDPGRTGAKRKGVCDSGPEAKGDGCQPKPSEGGVMGAESQRGTVSPLLEYESGTGSSRTADFISGNERFECAVEQEKIKAHNLDSMSSDSIIGREAKSTDSKQMHSEDGVLEENCPVLKGSPVEPKATPETAPMGNEPLHVPATVSDAMPSQTSKISPPQGKPTSASADPSPPPQQTPHPSQQPLPHQPTPVQSCPLSYKISAEKETVVIRPMEVKSRGQVEVIVSEVRSPALVWIQLTDSPLTNFVTELNKFYSDDKTTSILLPAPEVGTFCCARYSENNCWYRARILGVTTKTPSSTQNPQDPSNTLVDVIYIDYGNRERVNMTRVRTIPPEFTELPAQATCCSLGKVKPPVTSGAWTKEQTYFFASLVLGKIVQASIQLVKGRRMPQLDMSAPFMISSGGGEGHCIQVDIAQCMVKREMAQYLEGCGPPRQPLQPRQPAPDASSTDSSRDKQSKENTDSSLESAAGGDGAQNLTTTDTSSSSKENARESSITSQPSRDQGTRRPSGELNQNPNQVSKSDRQRQQNSRKVNERKVPVHLERRNLQAEIPPRLAKQKMECQDSVSEYHADSLRKGGTIQPKDARHQSQSDESRPRQTVKDSANKHEAGDHCSRKASAVGGMTGKKEHTSPINSPTPEGLYKSQSTNPKRLLKWTGRGSRFDHATNAPSQQMSQGNKNNYGGHQDDFSKLQSTYSSEGTMWEGSISTMEFRRSPAMSGRAKASRGNESKSTSGAGTGKQPDARDTPSPRAHSPEEEDLERMSPNSSSGVSSYNSGQSNMQAKTVSQSGCLDEDAPSSRSQESRRKASGGSSYQAGNTEQDSLFKPPEQSTTYKTSQDRRRGKLTGSNKSSQPKAEDLKSLSSTTKNLSSSSSSFFSAVGDLDTFETVSKTSSVSEIWKSKSKDDKHPQLSLRSSLQTQDGCVRMAMSHIVSPQEFYAHLITKDVEKLDYLDRDLNDFYNSEKKVASLTEDLVLEVGSLCAAKYTVDGTWYRARILEVHDAIEDGKSSDEAGAPSMPKKATQRHKKVQLMYVDYGNKEWLAADAIKPLQSSFYQLPAQVIKCCLAHIYPPDIPEEWEKSGVSLANAEDQQRGGWSKEAVVEFAKMTGYEKLLLGRLLKEYDEQSDEPLEVLLLDPSSPWEICINQQLVNAGLAASTRLRAVVVQQELSEPTELTNQQLLKASEGWNFKTGHEGYEAVEEGTLSEAKGQIVPREKWDPMTSDFTSNRNSYNIDVDDPCVATVGYKSESTRTVCKFYSTGRTCYRGNQCPHEHARQGERPGESVDVFYSNKTIRLPEAGSWVALQVTALQTAFHFWAQLPYSARPLDSLTQAGAPSDDEYEVETLEMLEVVLNQTYANLKRHQTANLFLRARGEMVCCQSPQDQRFYRARVREVDTQQELTQVFYVDYGNTEWVPSSNIHDMKAQFLHLPLQAVECYLVSARPVEFNAEEAGTRPDEEARKMFEEMVSNKTLVAHIANSYPILEVDLYDTNGKSDINIAMALIENGLATQHYWEGDQETSLSGSRSFQGGSDQVTGDIRSETSSGNDVLLIPG